MGHVTLGALDQVRDEVVAALELHVDLGKGVLVLVPADDEAIVDCNQPEDEQHDDRADA